MSDDRKWLVIRGFSSLVAVTTLALIAVVAVGSSWHLTVLGRIIYGLLAVGNAFLLLLLLMAVNDRG